MNVRADHRALSSALDDLGRNQSGPGDDDAAGELIPVLRPRLPLAEKILPYLLRIDETRFYSNFGPLASELETRLAAFLQLPPGGLVCASSGTAALIGAILAAAGRARPEKPLALIPSFTFVATAVAVEQCGYLPYLVDIDHDSWMLDAAALRNHPERDRVGLVVPVAPFGRPVPQRPWSEFTAATGIPVLIDGAASFAALAASGAEFLGEIPVAVSFHATKSFATGEGGAIATGNAAFGRRVAQALNFGIDTIRDCRLASTNGKMSEYHAAVGLAELDAWPEKLAAFQAVAERYRREMAALGLGDRLHVAPLIGPNYALYQCRNAADAARTCARLHRARIGYRLWYGEGVGRQTYYADLPRDRLDVTEKLAPCLLGLPMAPDLADAAIIEVGAALRDAA